MRVHIDPLFGTIAPCPVCGEAGIHLCPAEDQRRMGWNAAIAEAIRMTELYRGPHTDSDTIDSIIDALRTIDYDLDGGKP